MPAITKRRWRGVSSVLHLAWRYLQHARDLGMEVIEIGRCPVPYLERRTAICAGHTALLKLTGTYRRPPQTDPHAPRRENW